MNVDLQQAPLTTPLPSSFPTTLPAASASVVPVVSAMPTPGPDQVAQPQDDTSSSIASDAVFWTLITLCAMTVVGIAAVYCVYKYRTDRDPEASTGERATRQLSRGNTLRLKMSDDFQGATSYRDRRGQKRFSMAFGNDNAEPQPRSRSESRSVERARQSRTYSDPSAALPRQSRSRETSPRSGAVLADSSDDKEFPQSLARRSDERRTKERPKGAGSRAASLKAQSSSRRDMFARTGGAKTFDTVAADRSPERVVSSPPQQTVNRVMDKQKVPSAPPVVVTDLSTRGNTAQDTEDDAGLMEF